MKSSVNSISLCLLVVLTAWLSSASAQPPSTEPTAEEIRETIEQLGSRASSARNAASKRLRLMGKVASDAIAAAARDHPDPEIRDRATEIDRDFQYGLFPHSPNYVVSAIHAIRSESSERRRGGIEKLLDAEQFEMLLLALSLESNREQRVAMASVVLQHPSGQEYFLIGPNLRTLLDAIQADAGPKEAIREIELFTPAVIDSIASGGQLDILLEFFDSVSDQSRFLGLSQIASNDVALERLYRPGDVSKLLDLIQRGKTDVERTLLAARMASRPKALGYFARSQALSRLLDFLNGDQTLLRTLFASSDSLREILNNVPTKELAELLNRLKTSADKASAVVSICRIMNDAGRTRVEVIAELDQFFSNTKDMEIRTVYVLEMIKHAIRPGAARAEDLDRLLSALIGLKTRLTAKQLEQLVSLSDVAQRLATSSTFPWFDEQLSALGEDDQYLVLNRLRRTFQFMRSEPDSDMEVLCSLVQRVVSFSKEAHQDLAIGYVHGWAIPSEKQGIIYFDRLIELADRCQNEHGRAIFLQSIASKRLIMLAVIGDKRLQEFASRVDDIDRDSDRLACWIAALPLPGVVGFLAEHNGGKVLGAYRNRSLKPSDRVAVLRSIVQSEECLSHFVEIGEFKNIETAVEGIDDDSSGSKLRAHFYASPVVLERYTQGGRLDRVDQFLDSVDKDDLGGILIQFANAEVSEPACDAIGETVWRRVADIPVQTQQHRVSVYVTLLNQLRYVEWLIRSSKSEQILPTLRRNLTAEQFGAVVSDFLSREYCVPWLKTVSLESVLDASLSHLQTAELKYAVKILNSSRLVARAESTGQLDKMMDRFADLPRQDDESIYDLFHGALADSLLRHGFHTQLLAVATGNPADVNRECLKHLLRSDDFCRAFLRDRPVSELLEIARQPSDRSTFMDILAILLGKDQWVRQLATGGDLEPLLQELLAEPAGERSDRTIALWLSSPVAVAESSDTQIDALFDAERMTRGERLSVAGRLILNSPVATERLSLIGHFDLLLKLASQHQIDGFFNQRNVIAKLPNDELLSLLDRFEYQLGSARSFGYTIATDEIAAAYVDHRGIESLLDRLPSSERPGFHVKYFWRNESALLAILRRGEFSLLWNAMDPGDRGVMMTNAGQIFKKRQSIDLLKSRKCVVALSGWLESCSDQELRAAWFLRSACIARVFADAGLADRHATLVRRSTQPSNLQIYQKSVAIQSISRLIAENRIEEASAQLRQDSGTDTMRLIAFLMAAGLANDELESLQQRPANEWSASEKLRCVALLRALGKPQSAIGQATKLGLDSFALSIAIEQHDWTAAFEMASLMAEPLPSSMASPALANPAEAMAELAHVTLYGRLAGYARNDSAYRDAVKAIEAIGDSHPDDIQLERNVIENLLLMQHVRPAIGRMKHHPWQEFYLQRALGFYDPALSRVGWGSNSADRFFDAAARSTPINDRSRQRAVTFLLDVADTLREIGRYPQAALIDAALAEPGDHVSHEDDQRTKEVKKYQTRLLGQWIQRGNPEACEKWLLAHQVVDEIAVANEVFRGLGPDSRFAHDINRLLQSFRPQLKVVPRLIRVHEILRSASGGEPDAEFILLANRQIRETLAKPDARPLIFDTVTQLWAKSGELFPLEGRDAHDELLDRCQDWQTWCSYAVARFRSEEYSIAERAFAEALKMEPTRVELMYLQGEAFVRGAKSEQQLRQGEANRRLALRIAFAPEQRIRLGQLLLQAGMSDEATRQLNLVKRTTHPGINSNLKATSLLADHADDWREEMQLRREILVSLCRDKAGRGTPSELLDAVQSVHRAGMHHALQTGNDDLLRAQWKWSRVVNPHDVDWMKEFIPLVDKAKKQPIADEMFAASKRFLDSRVDKFDQSDYLRRQRAELCIACNRSLETTASDLDAAIHLSQDSRAKEDMKAKRRQLQLHFESMP